MKQYLIKSSISITIMLTAFFSNAQTFEWQLANPTYSSADPDEGGPATGVVTFKLQIRTASGSSSDITAITCGWSYQSSKLMVPSSVVACPAMIPLPPAVVNPSNITVNVAGFAYSPVQQCNILPQTVSSITYDKRVGGVFESTSTSLSLTTAWTDLFTVTLWTLGSSNPEGGFVMINSTGAPSSVGSPEPFISYESSNSNGSVAYTINSLTATTPLSLGSAILPVQFSKFVTNCNSNGTSIEWATTQEINTSKYEVEKSFDGNNWKSIATVQAAGNSSTEKTYQQLDLNSGKALYRIKQIDADGKFTYTGIETTNCTPKNVDIVIYPVPAKDRLNVAISSSKNINTNFAIYDATGRVVKQFNQKITIGNNAIQIDVNNLPSGQYIIKSTDEYTNINKKFTIFK